MSFESVTEKLKKLRERRTFTLEQLVEVEAELQKAFKEETEEEVKEAD